MKLLPLKKLNVGLLRSRANIVVEFAFLCLLRSCICSPQEELIHFFVERALILECFKQSHAIESLQDEIGCVLAPFGEEIDLLDNVGVVADVEAEQDFVFAARLVVIVFDLCKNLFHCEKLVIAGPFAFFYSAVAALKQNFQDFKWFPDRKRKM